MGKEEKKTTKPPPTKSAKTTKPPTKTPQPTTKKKGPDPKGDCGKPEAPKNGHTDSDVTTLDSSAKYVCNPGYDLIGNDMRKCTAIWNEQKGDYDYSWAPPLSVICKPNGKPVPKPKPKPKPKPTKKAAPKPTKKPVQKPTKKTKA